jgi:hypothetical protein
VENSFWLQQDDYSPSADSLEFKTWQIDDDSEINGWSVTADDFPNLTSQRGDQPSPHHEDGDNGMHAVDAAAGGQSVPLLSDVRVDVTLWLTAGSTVRFNDMKWLLGGGSTKTAPDFGWIVEDPKPHPTDPLLTAHTLKIYNDELVDGFWITGVKYLASKVGYSDLSAVPFPEPPLGDTWLAAGDSLVIDVPTEDGWYGRFVYHTFAIKESLMEDPELVNVGKHTVVGRVPALSRHGLAALGALSLGVAVVGLRRRRGARPMRT